MGRPENLRTLLHLAITILLLASGAAHGEFVDIKQVTSDLSGLSTALEQFSIDCGRYPTTTEGLAALSTAPTGVTNWKGPYITALPTTDPWKTPYQYISPGIHNPRGFDLASAGRDGKFGSPDDYDNWWTEPTQGNRYSDWPSLVLGVVVVVLVFTALWPTFIRHEPDQTPPEKIRLIACDSEQELADTFRPTETTPLSYSRPIPRVPRARLPLASTYAIGATLLAFMYVAVAKGVSIFDVEIPLPAYPGQYLWDRLHPDADYTPMKVAIWTIAFWSLCLAFPVTWIVWLLRKSKAKPVADPPII